MHAKSHAAQNVHGIFTFVCACPMWHSGGYSACLLVCAAQSDKSIFMLQGGLCRLTGEIPMHFGDDSPRSGPSNKLQQFARISPHNVIRYPSHEHSWTTSGLE